jgi:hypothetical protein
MGFVKWMRAIGSLTLALLWAPLAVHCQLETLPGLAFLACGDPSDGDCCEPVSPHEESDCEGDACAAIESGAYKTELEELDLNASASGPSACSISADREEAVLRTAAFLPLPCAPPELPVVWQFLLRAAAPPRAPSLAA